MKRTPISEKTRAAILDATWSLMAEKKRLDVSQAEIAAAAGVSRQTIFIAFGNRAGLLTAMARNKDMGSDHVARLREISRAATVGPDDFRRYIEIWLDYLPLIYPVVILLDAAALTDAEAASALDDRMKGALLAGTKTGARAAGQRRAPGPGLGIGARGRTGVEPDSSDHAGGNWWSAADGAMKNSAAPGSRSFDRRFWPRGGAAP